MRIATRLLVIVGILGMSLPAFAESTEPTSTPAVPTLLVGKDTMTGDVVLTWSGTASPYSVVRGTEPNFFGETPPQIVSFGLGGTTFSDQVLVDGMDYFYSIEDTNTLTQVYSASADGGFPGDQITLTGVGFAAVLGDNEVFVAGEQAVVIGVTDTTLTFVVPTQTVTGSVVVSTPAGGASAGTPFCAVVTDGLPQVSSLAVDGNDVPFVATTGSGTLADRVFTFDPMTGVRTQVGLLGEATGLPVDNANGVLYGNADTNPLSQGSIERTTAAGGEAFYRQCAPGATCYVFGMGVDPDLLDFGGDGRLYVADGFNQVVKLVPPTGLIQTFASGFTFGNSPRGVVPVRDSGSMLYHDVFVGDSTSVRQFDSSTTPGTLVKTYDSTNSPVISPRQMDLTAPPRERLLIADDTQDRIIMINPATDASKLIDIPLVDPKGIAVDVNLGTGVEFAYVGEQTRVVMIPIEKTVYVKVWVANGLGSSLGPIRFGNQLRRANTTLERCGIDVQLRGNALNFFDAGALFDLEVNDFGLGPGQVTCVSPGLTRTAEEAMLLDTLRSSEPTDLNIYFVNSFTLSGGGTPGFIAETVTGDCFPDVLGMDETRSGIIVSVSKLNQWSAETVSTVAHEIVHALMNRFDWLPGQNEHLEASGVALPGTNIMRGSSSRGRWATKDDQCLNINADTTIFRGDP